MNVTIKDLTLLQSIDPHQAITYLEAMGWQPIQKIKAQTAVDQVTTIVWQKISSFQEKCHIILPLDRSQSDFPLAMSLMLETIEKVENISQLEALGYLINQINQIKLEGLVVSINPYSGDSLSGKITLMGVLFDRLYPIKMELFDRYYILAIKSYQERLTVCCEGDLIRENTNFLLKNMQNFKLCNT